MLGLTPRRSSDLANHSGGLGFVSKAKPLRAEARSGAIGFLTPGRAILGHRDAKQHADRHPPDTGCDRRHEWPFLPRDADWPETLGLGLGYSTPTRSRGTLAGIASAKAALSGRCIQSFTSGRSVPAGNFARGLNPFTPNHAARRPALHLLRGSVYVRGIHPIKKMKLPKILLALVVASFLSAGFALANDAASGEAKKAACCEKAGKDSKACDHECCTEAAKAGKNCEKCAGAGKAEAKK